MVSVLRLNSRFDLLVFLDISLQTLEQTVFALDHGLLVFDDAFIVLSDLLNSFVILSSNSRPSVRCLPVGLSFEGWFHFSNFPFDLVFIILEFSQSLTVGSSQDFDFSSQKVVLRSEICDYLLHFFDVLFRRMILTVMCRLRRNCGLGRKLRIEMSDVFL